MGVYSVFMKRKSMCAQTSVIDCFIDFYAELHFVETRLNLIILPLKKK